MATNGQDKSKSTSHGVKIDSTLIPTVSGDVNDELSGLGVSVYNQDDFEAGVLQQIDTEVQKRNAEREKAMLIKEYNSVQSEQKTVQVELKNLSKMISGLLTQPLSHVVLQLKELRASHDIKRKQLSSLQAREQSLLRRLSGKEDPTEAKSSQAREEHSHRQRLIETGQITPFEATPSSSTTQHQSQPQTLLNNHTHSVTSTDSAAATNRLENVTLDSLVGPSDSTPTWGVKRKQPSPTIQLSTDSFDGLFSQPPPSKVAKKEEAPSSKKGKSPVDKRESLSSKQKKSSRKSRKGKDKATVSPSLSRTSSPSLASHSPMSGESSLSGATAQTTMKDSEVNTDSRSSATSQSEATSVPGSQATNGDIFNGEDPEDWIPSIEEFENFESEESHESEYFTDDELGEPSFRRKKRCRDLRPLSSDGLSSEDEDYVSSRKKKGRGARRRKKYCQDSVEDRKHLDDGDEELYRLRVSELRKTTREDSPKDDIEFAGGLRIPGAIWNRLYRYQQTGVKWLWELHCQQAGGIVGDEMGLGKTIQMIAFLAGLQVSNLRSHTTRELGLGPCLIVCPATVMHQWVSEFHSWWASFRVAVLHETGTFSGDKRVLVDNIVKECGVLVTTYAGIRIYQDLLLRHKWDYVVLDEGHKIRNPDAEITLACKQFPTPHRIILSGSPMQNNLRELWSLFDFVFPGKLGTLPVFMEQFSVPITMGGYANATNVQVQTAYRCACVLRDTINPYLLRRMKADVKVQLPNKNEQVLFCRLTDYQHEVYSDFLKGSEVERALAGSKQVFSALMTLRKLCNHPDLVTNDYSVQVGSSGGSKDKKKEGQSTEEVNDEEAPKSVNIKKILASPATGEEVYGHHNRSGKMIVVHSLLKLWSEQGHRVLLFSQSKMMLDILEMFVVREGYSYVRMDGGTQVALRQPMVKRFNEDPSIFVFLLTTRVGGLGVNLTGANRVILYDPDWNPSTDTQARERAWRIGQTRNVTVYRLLMSGTIEEKIYHRQIFKQFLTNRVLKDPRQRRFFKSNDIYDLFTLDSTSKEGSTETSAIFAGTGSEVTPKKRKKSSYEAAKGEKSPKKVSKKSKKRKAGSVAESCHSLAASSTESALSQQPSEVQKTALLKDRANDSRAGSSANGSEEMNREPNSLTAGASQPPHSASTTGESSTKEMDDSSPVKKKAKKQKRKKRKRALVDGQELDGVDHSCVYEPGSEDEESSHKQDDFILKKLFKKTGVHSAMKHDVIMSSADPDYILVEAEANKVAQSAVRALKASRRQCQTASRWGRPTWTGSSGVAGAPGQAGPRFGVSSTGASPKKQKHFDGEDAGTSSLSQSSQKRSLRTSSNVLLAKMRARNANLAVSDNTNDLNREVRASGIHNSTHADLLKEMRDYIATQCKRDGQASTDEILKKFSNRLPEGADSTLFRSLLLQICDFSRHLGDGLWSLKPEFR